MKKIAAVFFWVGISSGMIAQPVAGQTERSRALPAEEEVLKSAYGGAQHPLTNPLKISGYLQAQMEYGQKEAVLKVGTANSDQTRSFNRIGIRRGRIKLKYSEGIGAAVFQVDLTEKGVGLKDAYIEVYEPWLNVLSLRMGVFNRPFGFEIEYSSSNRASPERARVFQTLFPEERDLGVMISLQGPPSSFLQFVKLDAGLFAGNGIKKETDNRKDFIGHLSVHLCAEEQWRCALGFSYYKGSVYQGSPFVYTMGAEGFRQDWDPAHVGDFARREYVGMDFQLYFTNRVGMAKITAEYLFGRQPGAQSNSYSPNASVLPVHEVYLRDFKGGYLQLVYQWNALPLGLVLKYDGYDPNTRVRGQALGQGHTSKGDVAYETYGAGVYWRMNTQVKLTAYYEYITNETSPYLHGFIADKKDNTLNLRLQYKF